MLSKISWRLAYFSHCKQKEKIREKKQKLVVQLAIIVVVTTCWNSTCSMLTSAKLSIGYLVVGITRELDKKPSLYCYPIYINYMWSMLQQCSTSIPALKASCLSHVYSAVIVQNCAS